MSRVVSLPDGTVLVADLLPAGSELVRIHRDAATPYERMIVVSPDGEAIHLQGWIGKPLSPRMWRAARAALFPAARLVRWVRRDLASKTDRSVELPLG
jgi:hypothetical protein